jgi:glutathione-regulated potassium-efflux system ancillary protein KefC
MTATLSVAALWMALALIADALAFWLRVSSPVVEVIIGMVAQLVLGSAILGTNHEWVKFFSVMGAILLTFLAGAEIEPSILKLNWKQAGVIGLMSFFVPFGLCAGAANVYLGWDVKASWLAGIAMSTSSAAVVYAVLLQFGLSTSTFGKTILIATFVTDVATVLTLDLILTPFTIKTLIAFGGAATILLVLPWLTSRFLNQFGGLLSEIETKFILIFLLGLGALATWADSEAVFAGYATGMVLSGLVGQNHALIRRLRTVTFGLLTPFFFILAGSLVSIPSIITSPKPFLILLVLKVFAKFVSIFPAANLFGSTRNEAVYTSLLMSAGLTFGSIAGLFGLSHGIINGQQYSSLVAAVIASAVVPTFIANKFFLPRHLLPKEGLEQGKSSPEVPMFGKILYANDGSKSAARALSLALEITKQSQSELHIVCVEKVAYLPELIKDVRGSTGRSAGCNDGILRRVQEMADEQQLKIHTHVIRGHPVRNIARLSADLGVDLLVIGAVDHWVLFERLAGSRADRIMRLAQCPVLVVK